MKTMEWINAKYEPAHEGPFIVWFDDDSWGKAWYYDDQWCPERAEHDSDKVLYYFQPLSP